MKISYNWLKEYIDIDLDPGKVADILTNCGLETESVEKYQSVKGGLEGLVIGEVKSKEKHSNADKLTIAKVDVGNETLLSIVCGAPNLEAGQKVVVAIPGTVIHPVKGDCFEIKPAKIRGEPSEGMICAEDEVGLGTAHDGIIVLDSGAKTGSLAKDYFQIEDDTILEIGLTPNRPDAASHIGVARDLFAVMSNIESPSPFCRPSVEKFAVDNRNLKIDVKVDDAAACPRYSGITVSGVKITESPRWLQNRLKSIGLKPINNVVDITNFVLHETGQPLHAFDADKIKAQKIIVKKLPERTKFTTFDGKERILSSEDLMICNAEEGICIAGVLGGQNSGVSETTKNIFLESAYFDPAAIRKTAKRHELSTDASFIYERGADPNITIYALKRAAMLMKELAGGSISSEITDIYPYKIANFEINLSYKTCDTLAGKKIDRKKIKNILKSLDIEIKKEHEDGLVLSVPPFRVDVKREADVVEEILRIYGYNNIPLEPSSKFSFITNKTIAYEDFREPIADQLAAMGFAEIMTNSITKSCYCKDTEGWDTAGLVKITNPLTAELDVIRQTLLFGGLETVEYNQNRKRPDLKLYEFGKIYFRDKAGFKEHGCLSLILSGRKYGENWNTTSENVDFYYLKGVVSSIIKRLGIDKPGISSDETTHGAMAEGLSYKILDKPVVQFGKVKHSFLKYFDIKQDVFYAEFNLENIENLLKVNKMRYQDIPKFPYVRRDLALLIDKKICFDEIKKVAYRVEKKILSEVTLFDIFKGDKIDMDKKSYAVGFTFLDPEKTLKDSEVDSIMERMKRFFSEELGAEVR